MFTSLSLCLLLSLECQAIQEDPLQSAFVDDGLNLLQMKSSSYTAEAGRNHRHAMIANTSRTRRSAGEPAGDRERQLCPHELEEIKQETESFGCRGLLQAPATRLCNFWGDPHVTRTFPMTQDMHAIQGGGKPWDTLWQPGLFRMAAASDGSWEVQLMNCGTWAGAVAVRFGKHVVEFVSEGSNMVYFLNGRRLADEVQWPLEIGNMFIDNTHRKSASFQDGRGGLRIDERKIPKRGGCVDDPGGQVYVDVSRIGISQFSFSVKIEAAEGSFTTTDSDKHSLCNIDLTTKIDKRAGSFGQMRYHNWGVDNVAPEDSLFVGSGSMPCSHCRAQGWRGSNFLFDNRNKDAAEAACGEVDVPKKADDFDVEGMCKTHNIPVENAQAACVHLKDDPHFYEDCQLDFCATDASQEAVQEAEDEEHAENPQPVCAVSDDTCDPASFCCDALKDQSTLSFGTVLQNNLCGDGDGAQELRFGSVLTQGGQTMDLVVTPVNHDCGRATNDRNGHKSDMLANLAVQAGREGTFDFTFVVAGTDTPATPKSVVFSFLDLDQGKKGKQQESVEVCGTANAVVTDTTELQQSSNGNCLKFTSSTWGNGKDNPNSPDTMSQVQRNRAVAYQVTGSSIRVTLGVTGKGSNPRKFLFAGHPSIACK